MEVYLFDDQGRFSGAKNCQKNPLQEGAFLVPAMSTDITPCEVEEGFYPYWNGDSWEPKKLESAMTDSEKVSAGLIQLRDGEILDGEQIRMMTPFEMACAGKISIAMYKDFVKSSVESTLLQRLYSGFNFDGQKYPADIQAQTAAIDAGQDFEESGDTSFLGAFCKANVWVPMDEATFSRFRTTGRRFVRSLFNSVWELKHTQIAGATTPEEVKAFFDAWNNS